MEHEPRIFILPDERNRRLIEPWHENRDDSDLALGPLAGDLFELVKARLSLLVLLTTLVGFLMGWQGPMNYLLLAATLTGTALCACGAAALNQWWERDLDARMKRTQRRPSRETDASE